MKLKLQPQRRRYIIVCGFRICLFKEGESGEMRMRMKMKVGDVDVCCRGVGMEIGLRRVVIVSLLAVVVGEEEEAEFRLFL